ncbi:hypothetical protein D9757_012954 [Collybiopsis confluens]|nr:hypothetical protein D9757_012954 [Collybiopsis confluens]
MALSPSITEGFIKFNVAALPGKPCQTYYKIIGTLGEGATPLIALHGGPGVNHEYLLVLADLGIPLVVYDQIGTGKSTHYPEKMGDISFWTDQLFLDELETVIHHLGLQGDYNLAGHSWGGMLAARHAVLQPKGLKRLILMSTPADMKLWIKSQSNLRKQLPQTIQDILTVHEESKTTDSKEYQEAMGEFYGHFLCTIKPMPEPIVHGFGEIAKDPTVYLTM